MSALPLEKNYFTELEFGEVSHNYLYTEEQVLALIQSIRSLKANGSDVISTRMLKLTATSISASSNSLLLVTGKLPLEWRLVQLTQFQNLVRLTQHNIVLVLSCH